MTCRPNYDVKEVFYEDIAIGNYLNDIGSAFKQILSNKDLVLETKGENAITSTLNGTRTVNDESTPLRISGSIKISKNFDSALMANHKEIIEAGLGSLSSTNKGNVTVTGGTGSVGTPFLTTSTTNLANGNLVYIPNEGLRIITGIVANTSFTVDTPIDSAISTSTVFKSLISCDITSPKGTCTKAFNVICKLSDGNYVVMYGCVPLIEFKVVFEKQIMITITFTSPEITEVGTLTYTLTNETKGTPVKANFDSILITDDDGSLYGYAPQTFDLGWTATLEPQNAVGLARNNVQGYRVRTSILPKIQLDRFATTKAWALNPSYARLFSFYQSTFGIYIQEGTFFNVDKSVNNNNADSIMCDMNVNTKADKKVYIFLPQ